MLHSMRRVFPALVSAAGLGVVAGAATAGPTSAAAGPASVRVMGAARTVPLHAGRPGVAHAIALPFAGWRPIVREPQHTVAPSVYTPLRVMVVPATLPQFRFTTALSALRVTDCTASPSAVLVSEIPAAITPLGCAWHSQPRDDGGWPAPSLAPGHNKDALYGPAFQPHRIDP